MQLYMSWYIISFFLALSLFLQYSLFFKYPCISIFHRRSLYTFYYVTWNQYRQTNVWLEGRKIWWRHQMETFSTLLAFWAGTSPATGEFASQRPVTRSFDVFFNLRWINGSVNNGEAGDLRRHRAHYDVTVMGMVAQIKCPPRTAYMRQ